MVEIFKLNNDWDNFIGDEFSKEYYLNLREFLKEEYSRAHIYPPMDDIYNALKYTPFSHVKAVILGQDPYHGVNQAHGLAFSVKDGIIPPPSLMNIYAELKNEFGYPIPTTGNLTKWCAQGVLLLNTCLTVREASPNSHQGKGWEILTDKIISSLNAKTSPVVFLLWGNNARSKKALITNPNHLVLQAPHPSPLSAYRGFLGCNHFKSANDFLISNSIEPIDWRIS